MFSFANIVAVPVNIIFSLGILFSVYLMWKMPGGVLVLDSLFTFLIGFFIFGPQMLIGVAAAELSHKKAAGTATGFIGWFAYIGAAMAGGPMGAWIERTSWNDYFLVLMGCAIIVILGLLPLWRVKANPEFDT